MIINQRQTKGGAEWGSRPSCFYIWKLVTFGPRAWWSTLLWQSLFCVWASVNFKRPDISILYPGKRMSRKAARYLSWKPRTLRGLCFYLKCVSSSAVSCWQDRHIRGSLHLLPIRQLCRPRDPFAFHSSLASFTACSVKAMIKKNWLWERLFWSWAPI